MGALDGIIGSGAGAIIGMAMQGKNDKRQLEQQKKLQELQIKGQQQMGIFNRQQQQQLWEDTNYSAQRKEMEKAGVNVGMMYGMGGGGGATAAASSGNVTGANAPTGGGEMQAMTGMGLQAGLATAQIDLMKAQTEKTKVEAEKTAGVDTELGAANIKQTIAKALETELQNTYMSKGAYKDGMTGYEVKYQQEAAKMYNTIADTEIKKLNLEQMPTQLQNEVKKVVLEGQRVAIDAINARTAQERNAITERIEALKRNLMITMQGQELQMQTKGQENQNRQFNQQMEQKDEDQLMQWVDKVMGAAVPWYEPSTTTETRNWSDDGETYRSGGSSTTRRRN